MVLIFCLLLATLGLNFKKGSEILEFSFPLSNCI